MDADNLTPQEIDMLVGVIKGSCRTAMLVPLPCAQALVLEHQRGETLMSLLDPTRYIQEVDKTRWHGPLLDAFLEFRRKLEEIKDDNI